MIIRVESASGQKRVTVDPAGTVFDLQVQIEALFKIPVEEQILSRAPLHKPDLIEEPKCPLNR